MGALAQKAAKVYARPGISNTGKHESPPGQASPGFSAKAGWLWYLHFPRAEARSKVSRMTFLYIRILTSESWIIANQRNHKEIELVT